jgi:hypothetical protein
MRRAFLHRDDNLLAHSRLHGPLRYFFQKNILFFGKEKMKPVEDSSPSRLRLINYAKIVFQKNREVVVIS